VRRRLSRIAVQGIPPQPLFASVDLMDSSPWSARSQTLAFDFFGQTQADEDVDDLEQDQGHDQIVDEHSGPNADQDDRRAASNCPRQPALPPYSGDRKKRRSGSRRRAADTVHPKVSSAFVRSRTCAEAGQPQCR